MVECGQRVLNLGLRLQTFVERCQFARLGFGLLLQRGPLDVQAARQFGGDLPRILQPLLDGFQLLFEAAGRCAVGLLRRLECLLGGFQLLFEATGGTWPSSRAVCSSCLIVASVAASSFNRRSCVSPASCNAVKSRSTP